MLRNDVDRIWRIEPVERASGPTLALSTRSVSAGGALAVTVTAGNTVAVSLAATGAACANAWWVGATTAAATSALLSAHRVKVFSTRTDREKGRMNRE